MHSLKSFLIALTLLSVIGYSTPTQASLGGMVASPALVTAGIVVAAGGAGLELYTIIDEIVNPGEYQGLPTLLMLAITVPMVMLGLLILEEDQKVEFSPMSAESGKKLGLSPYELMAYNSEIDQINALSAYVDSSITEEGEAGLKQSRDLWNEVKGSVSEDAFSAVVKIVSPAFKQR